MNLAMARTFGTVLLVLLLLPEPLLSQCDLVPGQVLETGFEGIGQVQLEGDHLLFAGLDGSWAADRIDGQWVVGDALEHPGASVSVSGNLAVLGRYGQGIGKSTAGIYRRVGSRWRLKQVVTEDAASRSYASAVASNGDWVAIGDLSANVGTSPGAVWIYESRSGNWSIRQTVDADMFLFGSRLAMNDRHLLVSGSGSGIILKAYLLDTGRDEFVEVDQLHALEVGQDSVLDLHGDLLVIGNRRETRVLVYRFSPASSRWEHEATLQPATLPVDSRFGEFVSVSGDRLLVTDRKDRVHYLYNHDPVERDWFVSSRMEDPHDSNRSRMDLQGTEAIFFAAGTAAFFGSGAPDRAGNVGVAIGPPEDVLLVNGSPGSGISRVVEYRPLEPFDIKMRRPRSVPAGERAPFALYAWQREPSLDLADVLPFGLGCVGLPFPMTGGEPQPRVIWNNAGRRRWLGVPTRPSRSAPSIVFQRSAMNRAGSFYLQGIIHDLGSLADVTASVTNGIWVVPVY